MTWWRKMVAVCALAGTFGVAAPARAGYLEDAGWGSLAAISNLAYIPAKLVYSALGGVTGGLAYGLTLGDLDTAQNIWTTSMGGTYVLTPGNLRGEEPIAFAYYPEVKPLAATPPADDAGWTTAEMPGESSLGGAAIGSTSGGGRFEEHPAGGF
ncbi:MAG TPA: hypothetical protein VNK92_04680 [Vicinamibacterales bacterium]|nr:hypothetical protein [Vicinamibacterales bacterium]